MPKIRELLDFHPVKDVIDIDSDLETSESKRELVKEYIISARLKEYLLHIADNIAQPKHKAIQIIGGYGSGKSHLLAWLTAILENQPLNVPGTSESAGHVFPVDFIRDADVRAKFQEVLTRDFAVVQFELQPGASELSAYFFDRVEWQLQEKHQIVIPVRDASRVEDFKHDIKEIVSTIKAHNPKMGLVVIIDEVSDFLKQKSKQQINRDIQFLRVLGQVSQTLDFLFIASMQENVFSSYKYVDEAESFGRVSQRFEIVTISREDIKQVIAQRILKKSAAQRQQLDALFGGYKAEFPIIQSDPETYIDLFPIHPYVIKIFDELPYFEKRGVIQFTMEKVAGILDAEFPRFITYDDVFNEINAKHTIRNLDEVRPIIEIVETLDSKIDLLPKDQVEARQLIKALGVLRLYGKTKDNGATPEELANELLIRSTAVKNIDRILIMLDKIRNLTSGQFIGKTESNCFYLSPEQSIDYDQVIHNKMSNLPEGMADEELLKLLKHTELLALDQAESYTRTFLATCAWTDKKSFRLGHFIYDDGAVPQSARHFGSAGHLVPGIFVEFNLVVRSPYRSASLIKSSENTAILHLQYDEALDDLLKKLVATRLLAGENYARTTMQKHYDKSIQEAKALVLQKMIDAEVEINGQTKKVKTVIKREPEQLDEFFSTLKEHLFNDYFSAIYPKYPKFASPLSYDNITVEVEETLSMLVQKGEQNLFAHAKNILSSLGLLDLEGLNTKNSLYAAVILKELEKNTGKNVKIEELAAALRRPPVGLDVELTQLVLAVLTYNGEINLKKKGGGTITASDLADVFKSGLEAFKKVLYAILETDFPTEAIVRLFKTLELNVGLVKNVKERTKAVQEFAAKALELQRAVVALRRDLAELAARPAPDARHFGSAGHLSAVVDVPALIAKAEELAKLPVEEFLKVKTVTDFKKVVYPDDTISEMKAGLTLLNQLKGFIVDYNEGLAKDLAYLQGSLQWVEAYPAVFADAEKTPLYELRAECKPLYLELPALLDAEQRRILKGKLQQYQRKYADLYYHKHLKTLGSKGAQEKLEALGKSHELKRLRNMQAIKCVNAGALQKVEHTLAALSQAQCVKLQAEHLKDEFCCPWCRFPENLKNIGEHHKVPGTSEVPGTLDIDPELEQIQREIFKLTGEWEKLIVSEVVRFKDHLQFLGRSHRQIVENMIGARVPGTSESAGDIIRESAGHLPDDINSDVIAALNALFAEIKLVEVSARDLAAFVFADGTVMDYESFARKLDDYKDHLLEQGDRKNLRIKLKE